MWNFYPNKISAKFILTNSLINKKFKENNPVCLIKRHILKGKYCIIWYENILS